MKSGLAQNVSETSCSYNNVHVRAKMFLFSYSETPSCWGVSKHDLWKMMCFSVINAKNFFFLQEFTTWSLWKFCFELKSLYVSASTTKEILFNHIYINETKYLNYNVDIIGEVQTSLWINPKDKLEEEIRWKRWPSTLIH